MAEVAGAHGGHVGLRVARPGAHAVRVLPGVLLDRLRGAAVGVALAQHRVDRAALDLVVAGLDRLLLVGLRLLRVVGQVEALGLQLGDGRLQLRDRGADVRQLDDVRLGRLGELAELREGVVDLLLVRQVVGEDRQDATGQRDVAGLDRHAGVLGERLDDRQQRVGRQRGGFVGLGVDDGGLVGHRFLGKSSPRRPGLGRGEPFPAKRPSFQALAQPSRGGRARRAGDRRGEIRPGATGRDPTGVGEATEE